MNMPAKAAGRVAGAGAVVAATAYLLSALCCLPVALGAAGVALAGASGFLGPIAPYLGVAAVALLAGALWLSYRRPVACAGDESCAVAPRRRLGLWLLAAFVLLLLSARFWMPSLLLL